MPNLLDAVYLLALAGAAPYLAWQRWRFGKYRRGWWQKLTGSLPPRTSPQPCAWIHAVSVGEVLLLRPFLAQMRQQHSEWRVVLTVGTESGFDVARQIFPDLTVAFAPLDFSWAIRQAFERLHPNLIILAELELWPNWLREAARRHVPVFVINARLSDRSYRRYRWLGRAFRRYTQAVHLWAVQNQTYAQRLRTLGVPTSRIVVSGSMKFDGVTTQRLDPRTLRLARLFGLTPPGPPGRTELVWVAGSTQEPEEEIVLKVYARLQQRWPELRLVLVPRHRERFDSVAQLIQQHGWPVLRRSSLSEPAGVRDGSPQSPTTHPVSSPVPSARALSSEKLPIILVDTLGELADVWGLADVAFVGGSFGNRGGQNMLEPAALGVPTVFGPNVWNFREIAHELLQAQAAWQVHSPDELYDALSALLSDPLRRQELGARARQTVLAHQGAVYRTLLALRPWLIPSVAARLAA
ncbi:3-deoxy-D-manno-octulosonic acid transferase [bacterium HR36]|nr:3-deoxy-D-manno-octulosonic acid transferase [bacterium HR36]